MGKRASFTRRGRRNYFPEPKFQLRFLRFLALGAVLQICATVTILYYFLHQNYVLLVRYAGLDPQVTQILFHELRVLIAVITLTFLIYLGAVLFLGVIFSHRIAGVIYALKRTMRDVANGREATLKLRERDEFQELAEVFNQMVGRLREQGSQSPSAMRS